MDIIFSRHAKRRMKLYSLSEDSIRDLLAQEDLIQGKNEILKDQSSGKKVIKIVVVVE